MYASFIGMLLIGCVLVRGSMPLPKKPVAVRLQADGLLSDCVAEGGAEVLVGRDILLATAIVVLDVCDILG